MVSQLGHHQTEVGHIKVYHTMDDLHSDLKGRLNFVSESLRYQEYHSEKFEN